MDTMIARNLTNEPSHPLPPAARRFTGRFLKKLPREASGPVKHPQKLFINMVFIVFFSSCPFV
jgi:hypothetical protein